ncbi:putative Heterokaryon incompatibility domain-containing protein [Seiridium cardinale]|uniref:Heterokaryon incompatibility domain-containing protein n=1 Tax=Seiridium cardinale TaxID=138064 RepID=A0ABR2Y2E3_9PEZI
MAAPSPAKRYNYHKLVEAKEIRLLKLLPGKGDEPICMHVDNASIDAVAGSYEALSYTWDTTTGKVDIAIDSSGEDNPVLPIYSSLESILRYLRKEHEMRILWIDAVCINQDDIPERNKQVPLMREIYSRCARVIAWLGEESQMDKAVFDTANRDTSGTKAESGAGDSFPMPELMLMVAGLTSLLRRPWFSRVWIIQEAALCPDLVLQCGYQTMDWEMLMAGCEVLFEASRSDRELVRADATLERIYFADTVRSMMKANRSLDSSVRPAPFSRFDYESAQPNPSGHRGDLQFFVTGSRQYDATNPRDHIYGLMGLVDDTQQSWVPVDYNKDEIRIVSEFIRTVVEHTGDLTVLGQSYYDGEKNVKQWPSWMPDWKLPLPVSPLSTRRLGSFRAGGDAKVVPKDHPDNLTLLLSGVFVDTVKEVTEPFVPLQEENSRDQVDQSMTMARFRNIVSAISKIPGLKDLATNLKAIFTPKDEKGEVVDMKPETADESIRQFLKVVQPGMPRAFFRLMARDLKDRPTGAKVSAGPSIAMVRSALEDGLMHLENVLFGPVHSTVWDNTRVPASLERKWSSLARKVKKLPTGERVDDAYWRTLIGNRRRELSGNMEQAPEDWRAAYDIWYEQVSRTEGVFPRLARGKTTNIRHQVHPFLLDLLRVQRAEPEKVPDHLDVYFRRLDDRKKEEGLENGTIRRRVQLYGKLTGQDTSGWDKDPSKLPTLTFTKSISVSMDSKPKDWSSETVQAESQVGDGHKPQNQLQTQEAKKEENHISVRRVARKFDRDVVHMAKNRRFCITKKGYIGWAPPATQAGDRICIIRGSQVPYVVRPTQGGYLYIGESYIHGIMDGEGLAMGGTEDIIFKRQTEPLSLFSNFMGRLPAR